MQFFLGFLNKKKTTIFANFSSVYLYNGFGQVNERVNKIRFFGKLNKFYERFPALRN